MVGGRSEGAGTPGQKQRMSSDPASTSNAPRGGFKTHRLVTLLWVHGPLVDRVPPGRTVEAGPRALARVAWHSCLDPFGRRWDDGLAR